MQNKIWKLFLILCMVTALVPLPHLIAAEEQTGNIIRNGDIENAASMKNDWEMEHGEVYEYIKDEKLIFRKEVTNDLPGGKEGYALKIVTTETKKEPYFRQRLYKEPPKGVTANKIIPGATYKLSYSIYAELEDCEGTAVPQCYLIYYSTNNQPNDNHSALGNRSISYTSSSTNNLWTRVEGTFKFPSEAIMLCILMQSNAKGTVYFDDISLELVEVEKFEYNTSHMFHYTGEKEGRASVTVSPFYQGTGFAESVFASFGIYDGAKRIAGTDEDVPFINEEAAFTYYNVEEALKEKGKKYTLSISVKDASGKEVDTFTQSLYRYDRPNFLDADGNFRNEDGEVIDPFIAWNLRTDYLDEAKKAGCTMSTMDFEYAKYEEKKLGREAHMKAAKEAGIYSLFGLCIDEKVASDEEIIENTKKIVKEYVNDRSFVGWLVKDEPLGGAKPEEKEEVKALLEKAYTTIREFDSNHPIILTDYHKEVFKETTKYCDIFITDSYGRGFSNVRSDVEEAVKYSNGRPVWTNINAYASGAATVNELPSGQEVQHFIHQAFLGGAKGVGVYEFNMAVRNPETPLFKTPIWNSLVDTGNTEMPLLFDLFVHGKDTPEKEETLSYVQRKWTREDGDYYFLMSKSESDTTVEYNIGTEKGVKLLGGDSVNDFTLSEGALSVFLESGDVLMFKVFDAFGEAQITKNGIGIKNMQTGTLTYMPPTGAEHFAVALYTSVDGVQNLEWIYWYTGEKKELSLLQQGEQYEMTAKVFSWDDALKPLGKAAVVPPMPNPKLE